jgi:prolyl-tRNA synthetase
MMQDGRALQAGTSHDFGTTLADAFEVAYQGEDGASHQVHATSFGMSTRTIGGVLMSHGDDRGAIFPPAIAPIQVAIVPVPGRDEESTRAVDEAASIAERDLAMAGFRVTLDNRAGLRPGAKFFHWERRGVPLRLEIGPRDVAAGQATAVMRHDGQKGAVPLDSLVERVREALVGAQLALAERARALREERTRAVEDRAGVEQAVVDGFALARWCESKACADEIQEQTRATIRCFPFERTGASFAPLPDDPGACAWCTGEAKRRVIIARAY